MWKRILITGVTAAAIVGTGAAALAASGAGSTSGSGSTGQLADRHRIARAIMRHAEHGQIVTKGADGYVRHDGVVGTVDAVSAKSITVRASDGYRETFDVASTTIIRQRSGGSGSASSISAVHTGDTVAVLGRTTDGEHGTATARVIVDGLPSR